MKCRPRGVHPVPLLAYTLIPELDIILSPVSSPVESQVGYLPSLAGPFSSSDRALNIDILLRESPRNKSARRTSCSIYTPLGDISPLAYCDHTTVEGGSPPPSVFATNHPQKCRPSHSFRWGCTIVSRQVRPSHRAGIRTRTRPTDNLPACLVHCSNSKGQRRNIAP